MDISTIVSVGSGGLAVIAVVYALFKVSKAQSKAEDAVKHNVRLVESNKDLVSANNKLQKNRDELLIALEKAQSRARALSKELVDNLPDKELTPYLKDVLDSLQKLSEKDNEVSGD